MTHIKDYGRSPFVTNIEQHTLQNETFRTTLWTGEHIQLTLMAIQPNEDIGLEVHNENDQFLRIESGQGTVHTGESKDTLQSQPVVKDDVILVPAGTWHNLVNTGSETLKLYSVYGPPDHVAGTVHETKEDAEMDPDED
jgi:mannose-6-phosphate isomerase-like protein (cupin superfamily)